MCLTARFKCGSNQLPPMYELTCPLLTKKVDFPFFLCISEVKLALILVHDFWLLFLRVPALLCLPTISTPLCLPLSLSSHLVTHPNLSLHNPPYANLLTQSSLHNPRYTILLTHPPCTILLTHTPYPILLAQSSLRNPPYTYSLFHPPCTILAQSSLHNPPYTSSLRNPPYTYSLSHPPCTILLVQSSLHNPPYTYSLSNPPCTILLTQPLHNPPYTTLTQSSLPNPHNVLQ